MRRRELLGTGLLLPLGARARPAPQPLADRMPAFWRAYDDGLGQPVDALAARLLRDFFEPHAADYRRAGMARALTADRIARWLAAFSPMADDVRALSGEFAASYQQHLVEFRMALPDFDGEASPVTLMPSLFSFDAHLEPNGSQLPLFFGPDGIVRYHGTGADLGVLFTHELFHCYQGQKNPAMSLDPHPPVFAALWMEGVATCASEVLNTGASVLHVLLDDRVLAAASPAVLRRVAAALLDRLDATEDAALTPFFDTGYKGNDWPARAGYYVGLLAARRIGKTMTLAEMAALPTPHVRALLARELGVLSA